MIEGGINRIYPDRLGEIRNGALIFPRLPKTNAAQVVGVGVDAIQAEGFRTVSDSSIVCALARMDAPP